MALPFRDFTSEEHDTWRRLFEGLSPKRSQQMVELFSKGLELLDIGPEQIPKLSQVNAKLESLTGFKGVPVEGLEEARDFFRMLANREFPIGNFIRDPKDLTYTPAPDVFHDLYGHIPFLIDPAYAKFCEEFGKKAVSFQDDRLILRQFERLFWFTIEFGLIQTLHGMRIFGAGIASSFSECQFSLSDKPKVLPFNLDVIRFQEFRIDEFQRVLFQLSEPEQLYSCLNTFEDALLNSANDCVREVRNVP